MLKSKTVLWLGITIAAIGIARSTLACPAAKQQSATASGHSVTLTWQPSPGAKYYCVYRSTVSKSGYQKIGTSPRPNYKDAPVPSGATLYYVVTAVQDKAESKYSSEIKAVVP
jgi:fibronectin type 3 domain-containing protein